MGSRTQMTKQQLLELLKEKDQIIAELNDRIDELESMAISSQAIPMNSNDSDLIRIMSQQLKALEKQLQDLGGPHT